MTANTIRSQDTFDLGGHLGQFVRTVRRGMPDQRGMLFGLIIIAGLIAFEAFNFSTTEYALGDLLGGLSFAGLSWATILALAFCSIDFAGIARLMAPHHADAQPIEVWYLLGAWFLGATMNAMLTWWSVSLALINHQGLGNEVLGREALLSSVPIFIAGLVWLIRVLLIGTLTLGGKRLFTVSASSESQRSRAHSPTPAASSRRSPGNSPRREPQYAPGAAVARARR